MAKITACAFVALTLAACDQVQGRVAADRGYRAYQAHDFGDAVAAYEDARRDLGSERLVVRNLALSHVALARATDDRAAAERHMEAGLNVLREALRADPRDREMLELLVFAWTEGGRLDEASRYFAERAGGDDEALRMLGVIEAQRGNYPAALEAFERRAVRQPMSLQAKSAVATLAWEWLHAGGPADPAEGVAVATRGLAAALAARQLDPSQRNLLVFTGLLLRERALRRADPSDKQRDLDEAERISASLRALPKPSDGARESSGSR